MRGRALLVHLAGRRFQSGEICGFKVLGYKLIGCMLQLPDDVKQIIEDAGARYVP